MARSYDYILYPGGEKRKIGRMLLETVKSNFCDKMDSQGRSLSSAVPIPQWMKSKMNNRFDLDQSTFSPTEMDDPFMYVNRIKQNEGTQKQNMSSVSAQYDLSKYTGPCRKFLKSVETTGAQKVVIAPSSKGLKSCGVDDGFKGEAAKCGSSIIKVAHDMVASRVIRGFSKQPEQFDPQAEGFDPYKRRGSKSLPASPITSPKTSPKSVRRNRFITPPYVEDSSREGWILPALLARRDVSQSLEVISEKGEGSISSNMHYEQVGGPNEPKTYVPRPSELREMNCWSPTSM